MNAEERTPVRSTRTPKRIGSTKPPRPPISPTMPEITPMSSGYSSEMYLNTEALPNAQATPTMNSRAVNIQAFRPMLNVFGPLTVRTLNSVCGYESTNRLSHETHSTHQVTFCAPYLSDSQPPIARSTPPGSEKHAASRAASLMSKPYSCT